MFFVIATSNRERMRRENEAKADQEIAKKRKANEREKRLNN